MMSLIAGDVVWVPFPYVEDNRPRPRPALIIASGLAGEFMFCWGLMITNAANPAWPGDVMIDDYQAAGLPIASRIRTAKVATLTETSATRIGRVPERAWAQVRAQLQNILGTKAQQ